MNDYPINLNTTDGFGWGSDEEGINEEYNDEIEFPDINPSEVTKNKIINIFKEQLNLNENIATKLADDIFLARKHIVNDQAIHLKATESCPYDIVVTTNIACCILKIVGTGEYSIVHKTLTIALDRLEQKGMPSSPSKPKTMAIKKSKIVNYSYSPEKRKIDSISDLNIEGIDYPFATFKENNGLGFSLHDLYNDTINAFPFHKQKSGPSSCIIQALVPILDKLIIFHDQGHLHRDIKGKNILFSQDELNFKTVLTDFGFFDKEIATLHETLGTVSHLDPTMFGNVEDSLVNQKKRSGCQNKQGDLYALGQTMIHDILARFIKEKSSQSLNGGKILNLLKTIGSKFTEEKIWADPELINYANKYPYRALYSSSDENKGIIIVLPSEKDYRDFFNEIFTLLKDCLSQDEIETLTLISSLACDLVSLELEKRPTAKQAKEKLESLKKETASPSMNSDFDDFFSFSPNEENELNSKPKSQGSSAKRQLHF